MFLREKTYKYLGIFSKDRYFKIHSGIHIFSLNLASSWGELFSFASLEKLTKKLFFRMSYNYFEIVVYFEINPITVSTEVLNCKFAFEITAI